MRRCVLQTAVAVASVLAVPSSALASPEAPASRSEAEQTLETAQNVSQGRGVRSGREYTLALRELAQDVPSLDPAGRKQANALLARPDDTGASGGASDRYSVPSKANCTLAPGFCVHWVESSTDKVPATDVAPANGIPDYVESVAAEMNVVRSKENGDLGWSAPLSDGTRGGDLSKTDVYLKQIGNQGIYGYASTDPGQGGNTRFAYLVLDNDYAEFGGSSFLAPLRVTAAHEYNHVLQYAYDAFQDVWLFESVAVWMEDQVYDTINDYLGYVDDWATRTEVPLTRFNSADTNDPDNIKVYGSAVWNHWLAERYGATMVRRVWERSLSTSPASFAPAAYQSAITASGGAGFFDDFTRFSAATAEWRAPGSGFSEGPLYPGVERRGSLTVDAATSTPISLDHTTFAHLDVAPPAPGSDLELIASVPSGTAGAIALVGRTGSSDTAGTVTTQLLPLPQGGSGSVVLPNAGSMGRITAVLVNADVSQSGYGANDWTWTKDGQSFGARARIVPAGSMPSLGTPSPPAPAPAPSGGGGSDGGGGGGGGSGSSESSSPATEPPPALSPASSGGVVLVGPRSQRRATVLRSGLAVGVRSADGRAVGFSVSVAAGRPVVARGSKVVGRGQGSVEGTSARTVRVRLSSSARRALARGSSLRLRVSAGTATQSVTVRR